ncbi:unnamed protein product [Rotaria magnacalcarata]|uniref:Uncharacterized protein n=1 Tax=Rotaria magnacalcarata TaxID=392030 RepID=A0A819NLH3_9BILA|nr:unnamed protein product [Rotaria magnacalcarata]
MSQQQRSTHDQSAGSINDHRGSYVQQEETKITKASTKCRDSTDLQFNRLYRETSNARPEEKIALKPDSRTNRNVTLCAAIARLLKEIFLSSITYSRNYQLLCGIPSNVSNNEFLLVMRTDAQQQSQKQKATPVNVCEVLDMYGNNGDERLTFLCQIRIHRKPRSKPIEFVIVAQLIDPSSRDQYIQFIQSELKINPISTETQQVNLVHSSASVPIEKPTIVPNSLRNVHNIVYGNNSSHQPPHSPFNGQFSSEDLNLSSIDDEFWKQICNVECDLSPSNNSFHHQQHSAFARQLSKGVAPLGIDDAGSENFFNADFNRSPSNNSGQQPQLSPYNGQLSNEATVQSSIDYDYWGKFFSADHNQLSTTADFFDNTFGTCQSGLGQTNFSNDLDEFFEIDCFYS